MSLVLARHGLGYPDTRRRRPLLGDESEKHFLTRVRALAYLYGWFPRRRNLAGWHQLDSTGTEAGLPDLVLLRPPRLIMAELKSQHGRLKIEQAAAIALLEQCPGVETYVWKPSDWPEIVRTLR